jgi:hypothetical protein
MELQGKDVTEAIIGASFEVYNVLGYGFLEKVSWRSPVGARIWAKCEIRMIFSLERKAIVKIPLEGGLAGRIPP